MAHPPITFDASDSLRLRRLALERAELLRTLAWDAAWARLVAALAALRSAGSAPPRRPVEG